MTRTRTMGNFGMNPKRMSAQAVIRTAVLRGLNWMAALMLSLLVAAAPMNAATKGPDGGGYTATDAAAYSYFDLSGPNGGTSVLAGQDEATATLNLPFSFQFYGQSYSMICASVNGALYFVTSAQVCSNIAATDFANVDLTTSAVPAPADLPAILPFWMDLTFDQGGGSVLYQTFGTPGNRRFVIQWHNAVPQGDPSNPVVDFEVVLAEGTNSITLQYRTVNLGTGDTNSNGGNATIGIRNTAGQSGGTNAGQALEWSFDSATLSNNYPILFQTSAAPGAPVLTSPAAGANGVSIPVMLTWNTAAAATSYDVHFGTTNPPPSVATGLTATTYAAPATALGTTYYWSVTAKNSSGSTSSAVASFTTTAPQSSGPGSGSGGTLLPQTITFGALGNHLTSDAPFTLSATASSGLAVVFTVVSGPATIEGNTVTLTGPGTVTIQANQAGNASFAAAASVTQSFTVAVGNAMVGAILNAASYAQTPLVADAYSAMFGSGFASAAAVAQSISPLPTTLGGVTMTITDSKGVTEPASLYYVSPDQINFVVPEGLAAGQATVTVTSSVGKSGTFAANIGSVAPALFSGDATGKGAAAAIGLVVNADNSSSVVPTYSCSGTPVVCKTTPLNVSTPGTRVFISFYGTGIRGLSGPSPVSVTIGGVPVQVTYAGAQPTYPGLDQINVLVPSSLAGAGEVTAQITVDGVAANPVLVNIE